MIFLDEIKPMRLYNKPFHLPINDKDKRKGNVSFLLTPDVESSVQLLSNPLFINNNYYESYYIEKDITYFINQEGYLEDLDDKTYRNVINEEKKVDTKSKSTKNAKMYSISKDNMNESLNQDILKAEEYKMLEKECIRLYSYIDSLLSKSEYKKIRDVYRKEFRSFYEDDLNKCKYGKSNKVRLIRYLPGNNDPVGRDQEIELCMHSIMKELSSKIKNTKLFSIGYDFDGIFIQYSVSPYIHEASNEVLNDPKRYVRSLKLKMNKAKYELNKQSDNNRNNIGVEKDSVLNSEKPAPGTANGTQPESPIKPEEEIKEVYMGQPSSDYQIEDTHMRCRVGNQDIMFLFNENLDETVLNEANVNSTMLHKLLYKERFKNNKEVFEAYDKIKEQLPWIKRTFLDYNKYKQFNLFTDLSYYNNTFFKNNIYKLDKGVELYFEFINRFIQDKRLALNGYTDKTVFVPIYSWYKKDSKVYDYNDGINPISIICRLIKHNAIKLQQWKGIDFVFLTEKGYFKADLSELEITDINKFISYIEKLRKQDPIVDEESSKESKKAIIANITDKIEKSQNIKIKNLTGDGEEITKKQLMDKIDNAASKSNDTEEAIDKLEEEDFIKNILNTLASEEDNNVKINASRNARMNKLNDEFLNKKLNGRTVRDMLNNTEVEELPELNVQVDTVNEEWNHLQYTNFESTYSVRDDIYGALHSLSEKTVPIAIRNIDVKDNSTSEDLIETYSVELEDVYGQRFTLKFDVPKLEGNKFMRLRGNDKTINGQLTQIPISKTDEDTVQIVSNYNKIFISRYGSTNGKSFVVADRIIKTINKMKDSKQLNVSVGNNSKICSKYELPIDYIDLSGVFTKIKTKHHTIYFNQDEIRAIDKVDISKGIPYAISTSGEVEYYTQNNDITFSSLLYGILRAESSEFEETFESTNLSTKYTYSKASILNNHIPLIVVMGYSEGMVKTLSKAQIKYELVEKRPKIDKSVQDMIRFKDGYLVYNLNYTSSLLMNGLKECNTEDFSLSELNDRAMWLNFLDLFGGRILADGLDNFYDMMIDHITKEVLEFYKLPIDYVEVLAYANMLLEDNKYFKHGDMRARRYRSNELIAGYVYKSIADSYGRYKTDLKRNKKAVMSMKQTEILDNIMLDPTASDLSILNGLLEIESSNAVTYKGLAGMNSDRAYSLDKRTFDDSMLNVLGLSTGFAGNVGITRQATMDMNITGKRGYIKVSNDPEKLSITKTFTATEALTPFGSRRDDPFRSAMTFIQTSKHGMRVKNSMPCLISNGADQALPYMITDTFAHKAKDNGKVKELTSDYMIIEYKDGVNDFIDLRERVMKNSDGGFYLTLKIDTDLKVGSTVKKGSIVAYDKSSFSDNVGATKDIAYNIGTLAKVAILNTDEGFEDSAIVSEWLTEAMASDIVIKKDIQLPKDTNIYNMVKKGQPIKEGDPLLIFQNAFEEEDVNLLLKNLAGDDENEISDLGRIKVKSKVEGFVEDVKIYRTVEKDELSDSLRKKVNELEKPISDIRKVMKKYDIDKEYKLDADYKLNNTGKLKNVNEGVLIEFFLKYEDKMSVGDKIIYYSALKGVIKDIFPKGKEPYTDFRKDEKIHSLLSLGSVNGRMVGSIETVGAINKVLIELDRKVKEMVGIKFKYLDEE